jgi:hypothetical protein
MYRNDDDRSKAASYIKLLRSLLRLGLVSNSCQDYGFSSLSQMNEAAFALYCKMRRRNAKQTEPQ